MNLATAPNQAEAVRNGSCDSEAAPPTEKIQRSDGHLVAPPGSPPDVEIVEVAPTPAESGGDGNVCAARSISEWRTAFLDMCEGMEVVKEELNLDTAAELCADLLGDTVPFERVLTALKKKDRNDTGKIGRAKFLLAMRRLHSK